MVFPNKQQLPGQKPVQQKKEEGCKIKIKRGKDGKVSSIETSGKCSRNEIEMIKGKVSEEIDGED